MSAVATDEYKNQFIPIELWGRDHWSTLAYLETHDVDHGGFKVQFDPRMRQNREHFRTLLKNKSSNLGIAMSPDYGSRLNNETYAVNHDDWNCVQDFAHIGFLMIGKKVISPDDIQPNRVLHLTEVGRNYAFQLREHKANGGNFSNFKI